MWETILLNESLNCRKRRVNRRDNSSYYLLVEMISSCEMSSFKEAGLYFSTLSNGYVRSLCQHECHKLPWKGRISRVSHILVQQNRSLEEKQCRT